MWPQVTWFNPRVSPALRDRVDLMTCRDLLLSKLFCGVTYGEKFHIISYFFLSIYPKPVGFFNHIQRKHKCPWRLYLGGNILNTQSLILPCPYPFCWMNYFHHTKFPHRTPHSMLIIISLLLHFIPRILTRAFCEVYGSRCNVDTLQWKALWQMALLWRGCEAAPSLFFLFPGLPGDMLGLFSSTDTQPSRGFRHLRERAGNLPVLSAGFPPALRRSQSFSPGRCRVGQNFPLLKGV